MSDALAGLDVMILCGGKGTRLVDWIGPVPKCLAPINGVPFLTLLVDRLKTFGARHFILCAGHLNEQVYEWVAKRPDRERFTVTINKDGPLQSAKQAMSNMRHHRAVILNGDTWIEGNLGIMVAACCGNGDYELKLHGKSTGIYIVQKSSLANDIFHPYAVEVLSQFSILDIGTPGDYAKAQELIR